MKDYQPQCLTARRVRDPPQRRCANTRWQYRPPSGRRTHGRQRRREPTDISTVDAVEDPLTRLIKIPG
eukprot:g64961.t1